MKIFLNVILFLYLYLFFGFLFHTSTKAVIFHRYTTNYVIALLIFAIMFVPFVYLCRYLVKSSTIKINNKKIILVPFKKILLLLSLSLILFVILEITLRIKYPTSESVWGHTIESFHPFLQSQANTRDDLHINREGFRGEEMPVKKPKNTIRIFVLGGSTVLSPYVSYEKSSVKVLGDLLIKLYPNLSIETVNAGNDWYASEHSIIYYLFKIKDYDPDIVIAWQGINDMYRSCSPPTYSYSSYKSDYSHFYGAVSGMVFNKFTTKPFISINSLAYDAIKHTLESNLYSDFKRIEPMPQKIANYGGTNNYQFKSINSYKRNLDSLVSILKNDNLKIILGNQANMYKLNLNQKEIQKLWLLKSFCNENGKYPDIKSAIDGMTQFNSISKNTALKHKVPYVDLEKELPKTLDYFIDDVHTTEKGDRKIAEALLKILKQNDMIKL